mgnify:CR=1 FL=1
MTIPIIIDIVYVDSYYSFLLVDNNLEQQLIDGVKFLQWLQRLWARVIVRKMAKERG